MINKANTLLILIFIVPFWIYTQGGLTAPQMLDVFESRSNDAARIATILFNPVSGTAKQPTPNPYPTMSINETAVEITFGSSGMNVNANFAQYNPTAAQYNIDLLRYIKNFYFYIEYVVKLEVAAKIAEYARSQNIDVITVLSKQSWSALVSQASQKAGGYGQLKQKSYPLTPNFELIKLSFVANSWQDIPKTAFWQSVKIVPDDIINSSLWQEYSKYVIARTFRQDGLLLPSIYNVEDRIFRYLPNFEIAYYQDDFTQLRNASEYSRLHLLLADEIRYHFLQQCNDWKKYINQATGEADWAPTYSRVLEFRQEDFYKFVSLAETHSPNYIIEMVKEKRIPIDPQYAQKPLVQEKLLCISMIKNLQALTNYLYESDVLESTMRVLANPTIVKQKPNPNFLFYRPDDYIYLEDLANIVDGFKQQAKDLATGVTPHEKSIMSLSKSNKLAPGPRRKVMVQGIFDWLSDTYSDISSAQISKDISSFVNDTIQAAGDELKAIGYTVAGGVMTAIDPAQADKLLKESAELQSKVSEEFNNAIKDATTVVDDAAAIANEGVSELATAIGNGIGQLDKNLGESISKQIESVLHLVIGSLAGGTKTIFAFTGGIVKLAADAINIVATVVVDVMVAPGNWDKLGQDVFTSIKQFGYDFVTSLLSTLSFLADTAFEALKNVIKFLAYGISMITDILIDVVRNVVSKVAEVLNLFGLTAATDTANVVADWLENHRRFIDTVVTTGLILAAIVLTDGAAAPILIMGLGPQIFQGWGAFQQDEAAKDRKAEQSAFVSNFEQYVNNNETIAKQTQGVWADELSGKFNAQIGNQELELGFYENFLNSYVENMKTQFGAYTGNYLKPYVSFMAAEGTQLTPNTMYADAGAIYGFNTNVLTLNPSQGFALYNAGRQSFSQEIAQFPALAIQTATDQFITSTTPRIFWFNQKETIQLDANINEVEIRFKPIYTLNIFYVGIYFGGKSINLEQIRKEGKADIDVAHHAKMFVYKKESKEDSVALGIYEHEGAGWLKQSINGPTFDVGNWYHMNLQLNGTSLRIKIWQEGQQEPSAQTATVLPLTEQKTFGIISAGASIEYQILKPKLPAPQPVALSGTPLRNPANVPTESEQVREKYARQQLEKNIHPQFGTFNLQPLNIMNIIRGKYIYTSKANDPRIPLNIDYLVGGCQQQGTPIKITEIGRDDVGNACIKRDQKFEPAVVSLVTNKAYNTKNEHITTCQNVYDAYLQQHGSLPDVDRLAIQAARKQYIASLLAPVNFGGIPLQPTSAQELINGQYIYWGISKEAVLRDKNGPAKDGNGKPVFDYFAMVINDAIGAPYDPTINNIRSFVTGNEYTRAGGINQTGYATGHMLDQFNKTFGPIRPDLLAEIKAAQDFYNKQPSASQGTTPSNTTPNQKTTIDDTATTLGYTSTAPVPTMKLLPGSTQESVNQQTEEAGAGEFSLGG